jgi:hypothetical protein
MLQVPKLNIVLADKTKSDLLDNISYKLRSLLHSIWGGIECLESDTIKMHTILMKIRVAMEIPHEHPSPWMSLCSTRYCVFLWFGYCLTSHWESGVISTCVSGTYSSSGNGRWFWDMDGHEGHVRRLDDQSSERDTGNGLDALSFVREIFTKVQQTKIALLMENGTVQSGGVTGVLRTGLSTNRCRTWQP